MSSWQAFRQIRRIIGQLFFLYLSLIVKINKQLYCRASAFKHLKNSVVNA